MLVRGSHREVYDEDLVFSYPDGRRNLKPHAFRHTLNTLLRERSYDADKIRASMGWSNKDVQDGHTVAGQHEFNKPRLVGIPSQTP